MSTAIRSALLALSSVGSIDVGGVVKQTGQTYRVEFRGAGTTLGEYNFPQVSITNPVGFTPTGVSTIQDGGRQVVDYLGLADILVSYHRGLMVHYFASTATGETFVGSPDTNPALFKRPVR
jgi:hypothetical protein